MPAKDANGREHHQNEQNDAHAHQGLARRKRSCLGSGFVAGRGGLRMWIRFLIHKHLLRSGVELIKASGVGFVVALALPLNAAVNEREESGHKE